VGVLIAYHDQTSPSNIYIQDILVDTNARSQGVAQQLLQALEKAAQTAGRRRLWLTSEPDNNAVSVWGKLGFDNPPADYELEGVRMTRDLKGPGKDRAVFEKLLT